MTAEPTVREQAYGTEFAIHDGAAQVSPAFLNALGVAVYTTDLNGILTGFNEAAVELWGRRPEIGKDQWCGSWRLFWPDGRPMAHSDGMMGTTLRENRAVRGGEAIAERPDGTRVAFIPYPSPLHDADGTLVGAVNVLVDITERKRAELALEDGLSEQSRRRMIAQGQNAAFALAVEGAPIDAVLGILVRTAREQSTAGASAGIFRVEVEADGACLRASASAGVPEAYMRAQDGFPISPEAPSCGSVAYTGRTVIVPDVEEDLLWAPYRQLARDAGFRACWSFPIRSYGGEVLATFALYHVAPSKPDARDVELVTLLADTAAVLIGRHKEVELRRTTDIALADALAAKDEFIGLVSHELRTPITTILGNAEILARRTGVVLDEETRLGALDDVCQEARRLKGIVEDLLTLARLDQGKVEQEPVRLTRIVEKCVAGRRDKTRTVDLIAGAVETLVLGDDGMIMQVVGNYLSNAEKYSPADSPIEVVIDSRDGDARVRVLDRGIGIEPGEQDRLFEAYYRSRNVGNVGGVGIGLSVCRRLMSAICGRCWAAPREGGGSEFGFALPIYSLDGDSE